jgi:hypothetical protein
MDPILNWSQFSKSQKQDAKDDLKSYLKSQRRLQRILTEGEWVSLHRDINTFDGDKVTTYEKTDGNNYRFYGSSATQLSAVNTYTLSKDDPTVHKVNWIVQLNPFQNSFILRDPSTPTREAHGHYYRKTDTMMLSINGPSGPAAQPFDEPAWGITTNYYTHIV